MRREPRDRRCDLCRLEPPRDKASGPQTQWREGGLAAPGGPLRARRDLHHCAAANWGDELAPPHSNPARLVGSAAQSPWKSESIKRSINAGEAIRDRTILLRMAGIPPGQKAYDQGFRSPQALRVSRHADELPQRNCWAKDGRRQRERASGALAYIPEAIT